MGEKISNDISSESTPHIHYQKIMHTSRKGLYQSCSQNCEISNFGFFPIYFSFSLTWDHMGGNFKRNLLWNNTPDFLPKIHLYLWGGSLRKLLKEQWNLKFWIFGKFCCSFFWPFIIVVNVDDKRCNIFETACRRAKPTKFWASGVSILIYTSYFWLSGVQFGVIQCISVFGRPCATLLSQKRLVVKQNGGTFGPQL